MHPADGTGGYQPGISRYRLPPTRLAQLSRWAFLLTRRKTQTTPSRISSRPDHEHQPLAGPKPGRSFPFPFFLSYSLTLTLSAWPQRHEGLSQVVPPRLSFCFWPPVECAHSIVHDGKIALGLFFCFLSSAARWMMRLSLGRCFSSPGLTTSISTQRQTPPPIGRRRSLIFLKTRHQTLSSTR